MQEDFAGRLAPLLAVEVSRIRFAHVSVSWNQPDWSVRLSGSILIGRYGIHRPPYPHDLAGDRRLPAHGLCGVSAGHRAGVLGWLRSRLGRRLPRLLSPPR